MKQSFSPNASRRTLECSPSAPMTRLNAGTAHAQTGPTARRRASSRPTIQGEQIRQQGQQAHQAVQQLIAIVLKAMQRIGEPTPLKADLDGAFPGQTRPMGGRLALVSLVIKYRASWEVSMTGEGLWIAQGKTRSDCWRRLEADSARHLEQKISVI